MVELDPRDLLNFFELVSKKLMLIFDSDAFEAAISSFFGAVGGYVIVELFSYERQKKDKIEKLKGAISMAHMIFNVFAAFKKSIRPIIIQYRKDQERFAESLKNPININGNFHVDLPLNYMEINFPYLDFDRINSIFFEKIDHSPREFLIAQTMLRSIYTLKASLEKRASIFFQINNLPNTALKGCCLYGIACELPDGLIHDTNFCDALKSIESSLDDCIWFSKELTQALLDQTDDRFDTIVAEISYSDVPKGIIPDDAEYKDWREKFTKLNKSKMSKVLKFLKKFTPLFEKK